MNEHPDRRAILLPGAFGVGAMGLALTQANASAAAPAYDSALNAKAFGAVGNGESDDTAALQAWISAGCGSPESGHGREYYRNIPMFLPPGNYRIKAPLSIRSGFGLHIFGAGRFTSTIRNSAGGSIFVTNGCQYSRFERMCLVSTGKTEPLFELDWDNTGPAALQSNTFADIYFAGGGYGVRIGNGGYMGSENLFANCYFSGSAVAGLFTSNYNALQQTVIGGNFGECHTAIHVRAGSVPTIHGVGFQGSADFDIQIDNQANDAYSIAGCRTESQNFVRNSNGATIAIAGCAQTSSSAGTFVSTSGGAVTLDACSSFAGSIRGNTSAYILRRGCKFHPGCYEHTGILVDLDGQQTNIVPATVDSNFGTTLLAAQLNGGLIIRKGSPGVDFVDTTDSAANILRNYPRSASILSLNVGTAMHVKILNTTDRTMTLQGGAGVTIMGKNAIPPDSSISLLGIVANVDLPKVNFYA